MNRASDVPGPNSGAPRHPQAGVVATEERIEESHREIDAFVERKLGECTTPEELAEVERWAGIKPSGNTPQ